MRRVKTGIDGLDQLTQGGLPAETVTLVSGPAGSGKSLLSLQFACQGATVEDEPALYVSLEESVESLTRALGNYRFNDFRPLKSGKLTVMDLGWLRKELEGNPGGWGLSRMDSLWEQGHPYLLNLDWMKGGPGIAEELDSGMVGFRTLEAAVDHYASEHGMKRLVIDSVAAVGLFYATPEELRRELFRFGRFLRDRHLTVMMITESAMGAGSPTRYGVEHFVADAHIVLGLRNVRGEFKRTIMIQKMRFSGHDNGVHPFVITDNGIEVNTREYIRS
jgi:KaiC/GvpD/RAD55 family RecA-like ATPase